MRVTTWNVNGLRAAIRKGFADHVAEIDPDVLLLQEIRVQAGQLPEEWENPPGWYVCWNWGTRPGYAGTAIWSRHPISDIVVGLDEDDDDEHGRMVTACVDGASVTSVYLPKGDNLVDGKFTEKQLRKHVWMDRFRAFGKRMLRKRRPVLVGGDMNIAHTERDIFYAKSNEKSSGFLPNERAWFGDLLTDGWRDLVREHYGNVQGPYSWWSNRGKARELDRGWRIDYLLGNKQAGSRFKTADIHRPGGLEVSDHAPVTVELD